MKQQTKISEKNYIFFNELIKIIQLSNIKIKTTSIFQLKNVNKTYIF